LALQQYLAQYETRDCQQTDCPAILLTRTFRLPENIRAFDPNTPAYYWAQRQTFLDRTVLRSPHLFWASTQFEREYDRILRRWHLWIPTCTQPAPDIIPSMPLLAIRRKPRQSPARCLSLASSFACFLTQLSTPAKMER
jgi:hypothetical protein